MKIREQHDASFYILSLANWREDRSAFKENGNSDGS